MKINYKNTALGLIDDPGNFSFGFPDPNITPSLSEKELKEFGKSLVSGSDKLKLLVGDKIEYASHDFIVAFAKAFPKLKPLFHNEEINDGGVLITGGHTNGYTHYHTYYYAVSSLLNKDGIMGYSVIFIDFSKHAKATEHALDVYLSVHTKPIEDCVVTKSVIWNGYALNGRDATYWEIYIIAFCLFKKYCDIETKIIDPKKNRRAKIAGQKYVNETDKRIAVLDITWFTNLVVSGAFGVTGHLRWQPYGPGLAQKKLIWISDYEKEGYTRKAKVLMQNNNDGEKR